MELKIINKKEDPLLSRIKVQSEIIFEKGTVSKEEIKNKLGKDLGKDEKLIVVKGIYTKYGLKKATNLSYIYENEEVLKKIEGVKKEKTGKKDAKSEEKPRVIKKEQKPKEAKEEQKKGEKEPKQEQKPGQKEAKQEKKPEQKQ